MVRILGGNATLECLKTPGFFKTLKIQSLIPLNAPNLVILKNSQEMSYILGWGKHSHLGWLQFWGSAPLECLKTPGFFKTLKIQSLIPLNAPNLVILKKYILGWGKHSHFGWLEFWVETLPWNVSKRQDFSKHWKSNHLYPQMPPNGNCLHFRGDYNSRWKPDFFKTMKITRLYPQMPQNWRVWIWKIGARSQLGQILETSQDIWINSV